MDRTTLNDRRGIAFHEAGHAVVAWALDCHVKETAIIGDDGKTSILCDYKRLGFGDRLALCLAGQVAEVLYDAPMPPRSAERVAAYLMQKDRIDENTFVELVLGG
jgi:hypothetical protein